MPRKTDTSPQAEAAASPPKKSGKPVLIVEDEKALAHALELKLTHEGYDVHVEMTGAAGLNAALTGKYELILLDLIMPEIDGFAVLQALKDKGIKTSVIVLSNLGQDEDRTRALGLGAKGYFVKANTPIAEIIKTVRTFV